MDIEYADGATPLDPNELAGLKLAHISTRQELDRWEQENILDAERWLWRRQSRPSDVIFSEKFIRDLHGKMFHKVWKWAGEFRRSEKNIGIECWKIAVAVHELCLDAQVWVEQQSYEPDEAAVRFHHRLVSIHPFANGNGRLCRLMADVIAHYLFGRPRFTWGATNLVTRGEDRRRYIDALHAADAYDLHPLLEFARS